MCIALVYTYMYNIYIYIYIYVYVRAVAIVVYEFLRRAKVLTQGLWQAVVRRC